MGNDFWCGQKNEVWYACGPLVAEHVTGFRGRGTLLVLVFECRIHQWNSEAEVDKPICMNELCWKSIVCKEIERS